MKLKTSLLSLAILFTGITALAQPNYEQFEVVLGNSNRFQAKVAGAPGYLFFEQFVYAPAGTEALRSIDFYAKDTDLEIEQIVVHFADGSEQKVIYYQRPTNSGERYFQKDRPYTIQLNGALGRFVTQIKIGARSLTDHPRRRLGYILAVGHGVRRVERPQPQPMPPSPWPPEPNPFPAPVPPPIGGSSTYIGTTGSFSKFLADPERVRVPQELWNSPFNAVQLVAKRNEIILQSVQVDFQDGTSFIAPFDNTYLRPQEPITVSFRAHQYRTISAVTITATSSLDGGLASAEVYGVIQDFIPR